MQHTLRAITPRLLLNKTRVRDLVDTYEQSAFTTNVCVCHCYLYRNGYQDTLYDIQLECHTHGHKSTFSQPPPKMRPTPFGWRGRGYFDFAIQKEEKSTFFET